MKRDLNNDNLPRVEMVVSGPMEMTQADFDEDNHLLIAVRPLKPNTLLRSITLVPPPGWAVKVCTVCLNGIPLKESYLVKGGCLELGPSDTLTHCWKVTHVDDMN